MKVDLGFWDKDGNYKEDIQEIEMLSVKDLNEIELIKGQNEGLKKQNADLQKENTELKAENERLKEEIKEVKKYQYEQEYLDKVLDKYKSCLQEIKEIAKKANEGKCPDISKKCDCIEFEDICFNDKYINCSCGMDLILQKISEVIE